MRAAVVNRRRSGQTPDMEQPSSTGAPQPAADETTHVQVTADQQGATARIVVVGELTDGARRPLVRTMTDLMLNRTTLRRVVLDMCEVSFVNSAGIAALVQLHKMAQPRGIELAVEVQGPTVTRPLRLSGLWHRFTIIDRREKSPAEAQEATHRRTEHS
jgi:anti-anti-sigma factor